MAEARKRMKIEFEKGGVFVAELLEDAAPVTCKTLWDAMPITGDVRTATLSGQIIFTWTDIDIKVVENPKSIGLAPGDVLYYVNVNNLPMRHQINFVFGNLAIFRDPLGQTPANNWARIIEGDLEELRRIGVRVWDEGKEKVVISRL